MFSNPSEAVVTISVTWCVLMFGWMLLNMIPAVDTTNWRNWTHDASVVGLVGVLTFFCAMITLRRWLDLPSYVTSIAFLVMAITVTPIAIHVNDKTHGRK